MIGLNTTSQTFLAVMMVVFTILLIALQVVRLGKAKKESDGRHPGESGGTRFTSQDLNLWICELLTVIALAIIVVMIFILYWKYIPADSPGCLPSISEFGVIASNIDPSKYAVTPAATYNATTYADAVSVYKSSPNGLATGYFSWDGLFVTILNSNAHQLKSGAPPGTSWVFQNLSTTVARVN